MKNSIIKLSAILVFVVALPILFSSCSKKNDNTSDAASNQAFFENSFLENDLKLSAATQNNTDLTSQFSKYTFRFSKTGALNGTISIGNTDTPLTALWTIDPTYFNLSVSISPSPAPFSFLNTTFIFLHPSSFTLGTLDKTDTRIITFIKI